MCYKNVVIRSQEPEPEPVAGIGAGAGQDWTGSTTLVAGKVDLAVPGTVAQKSKQIKTMEEE